jgi:UDP-N-acetylglucosamine 2-epimerase (non-hydrolysing)
MVMKKISVIFGTRPEAIKLCPLVLVLKENPYFQTNVCVTAQHREMLDDVLDVFGVKPDIDLNLMQPNQALHDLTCKAIDTLSKYICSYKPNFVLVQGDTTTTFCAALTAFYNKVPIGHVEAGLRTWNNSSPYPEEINRVLTTHLANYHFAPTQKAKNNLHNEGIPDERVFITGNTAIDALRIAIERIRQRPPKIPNLPPELMNGQSDKPVVLITTHRRENFGRPLNSIFRAIRVMAKAFPKVSFVYPVHMNPNIQEPAQKLFCDKKNIYLLEPLNYLQFVTLMNRAKLILTDSGGIQEEAPTLGKPVLVMRETTERPEAIEAGFAKLVGTNLDSIVDRVSELLTSSEKYAAMAKAANPYGDGHACERIVKVIEDII